MLSDALDAVSSQPAGGQFRRLIYTSIGVGDDSRRDHVEILRQSRANNGLDGVSGFLWTGPSGYLQVLEGTPEAVGTVFERIAADPRHRDVRIVSDQYDIERAFADWTMASLSAEWNEAVLRDRVRRFLRQAPDDVRSAFERAGLRADMNLTGG